MSLFDRKTPEEKTREMLEKYGLDINSYTDKEIRTRNAKDLKEISEALWGSGLDKFWTRLYTNPAQRIEMNLLSVLVKQTFILIRQNELILERLKTFNKK